MKRFGGRFVWLLSFFTLQAHAAITIESAVEALSHGAGLVIAGDEICATHPLPLFYARRNFQPAWNAADSAALLAAIRGSVDDGLNPADYHLAAIESTQDGEADILKTDAFFLLASHLQAGRVDPVTIEPTWCLAPRTSDLVPALETSLENHTVGDAIAHFRPLHTEYRALAAALAAYRQMTPWDPIDDGPVLRSGDRGPRVAQLVARLVASRDLDAPHATFDRGVEQAVRRFQGTHGIAGDGAVGPRTRRELNVALAGRIRQLELNLERWRWLPSNLGSRYAIINIPQFQLTVVENDQALLTMRIVVGKDFAHRTPVFTSAIGQVVFSPDWNVPESIAADEMWPKQKRDRSFFARNHITVLPGGGLRQEPGSWNALGRIKFDLPSPYRVYLHDTPSRELFSRSVRTFSHGCIRVEKPFDLAQYLLPRWPRERILAQSRKRSERAVDVENPLTVHVLYWTAFVTARGELRFAPDVYGCDAALDEAMLRPPAKLAGASSTPGTSRGSAPIQ